MKQSIFNSVPEARERPAIMLFGDPHGDFRRVIRAVETHRPAAVILLGDLTPAKPLHIELESILDLTCVHFIHGNHDTDSPTCWDNLTINLDGTPLAQASLHGRATLVAGLRVVGLGGIFRRNIWYPKDDPHTVPAFMSADELRRRMRPAERWRDGVSLQHRSTIFPADFGQMMGNYFGVDLLVTHEAPSCHQHGFAGIDELSRIVRPRCLVHGHHHQDIDYQSADHPDTHWLDLPVCRPYPVYGVDQGSFLALGRDGLPMCT
jgi:calcineurin-like phosphoesterase family protein